MIKRSYTAGGAGVLLSLGLVLGSGAAAAQAATGKHGHAAPLSGMVKSIGNGVLQVQPASGAAVNVSYNATTRVFKTVAGTTADLKPNVGVELTLVSGTTSVKSIQLEAARVRGTGTPPQGTKTHPHTHTGHVHGSGATAGSAPGSAPKHPHTGVPTHAGGQVVSLTGNTLTLKGRGATTASYTVSNTTTISKVVTGAITDVTPGRTVVVEAPQGGAARVIMIIK